MNRVVMLCLDGFPARRVGPGLTPSLMRLAESGGWARSGGLAVMPSSTYVNHATMLTGAMPEMHQVVPGGDPPGPPWEREAAAPSIFDILAERGIASEAVVGDHHLVHVLGLPRAHRCWPPTRHVPDGVRTDDHGWIVDTETLPRILDAVRGDAPFVFGHFNDPDTFGHDHGPDGDEAAKAYRFADGAVGQVMEALADDWDRTVLIVVSDHDMVPRTETEPVVIRHPSIAMAVPEGGAAWLWLAEGADPVDAMAAAAETPGVRGVIEVGGLPLAVLEPGRIAHWEVLPERGFHGGLEAVATVAVVGGGAAPARDLGRRIERHRPGIADWVPTILGLFDLGDAGPDASGAVHSA